MAKEAKAPMTLVWLKVLQPLCIFENIQSGCNSQVLCPVKNKQPHYPVISLPLSIVCFHTSFFPILTLQLPRTFWCSASQNYHLLSIFFTEWICYFTICHLISITAITSDSCLCWLRTTAETGDIFCQVLAVLTWKSLKWCSLLSHKRLPENLHKFLVSFFQNISLMPPLANLPYSRIISQ